MKNVYHEHASVARRSQGEVDQWITDNEVTLIGQNIPRPIIEFRESTFPGNSLLSEFSHNISSHFADQILNLLNGNYTHPTTIQAISWPVALSGRDMISIARTGSGKTRKYPPKSEVSNESKFQSGSFFLVLSTL